MELAPKVGHISPNPTMAATVSHVGCWMLVEGHAFFTAEFRLRDNNNPYLTGQIDGLK